MSCMTHTTHSHFIVPMELFTPIPQRKITYFRDIFKISNHNEKSNSLSCHDKKMIYSYRYEINKLCEILLDQRRLC